MTQYKADLQEAELMQELVGDNEVLFEEQPDVRVTLNFFIRRCMELNIDLE